MKISEVEKITGLTAKAIRLYEEKGLISVERQNNSYRDYDNDAVEKLKFIHTLREIDIPLSQICLHFNGVIALEELLNNRKSEMEKEKMFQQESYDKCLSLIKSSKNAENLFGNMADGRGDSVISDAKVLLGLDIGTTNISAVILDYQKGEVLDSYSIANSSKAVTESDFSECDGEWIFDKSKRIIDYLVSAYPNIKSIGLTGQMHGILYVSADGLAVSPFYNWQDGRGNRIFDESADENRKEDNLQIGAENDSKPEKIKTYCDEILSRSGYVCNSGYGFATMFYNKQNGIESKNAYSFCSIPDYVFMRLTDRKLPLIHPTNAASVGLYDIKNNCFDKSAVEKLGLGDLKLPKIAEDVYTGDCYNSIPISVGIGDNQASFFGSVKSEDTTALVNFGTGSQVSIVSDKFYKTDNCIEVRPYFMDKYLVCGSALCGGKAYAIAEKFFFEYANQITNKCENQYEVMNKLADEAYKNKKKNPVTVSTLFCGTRSNPEVRGSITGIDDVNFTPSNLILGILEGMAGELKTYFDFMEHKNISRIAASGNAVKRNRVLQQILKDVFNTDLILTQSDEEAAIGCALYSGVVCGVISAEQAKQAVKEKVFS